MIFRGIQKTSFIDFPGQPATVLFTGGCNFRCPYCHNGTLVKNEGRHITSEEAVTYLISRKKFVDALCISGGEPTLHGELYDFIKTIKGYGFKVKLDTNGTRPARLRRLLDEDLLDYIAMDIKAPLEKYEVITQKAVEIGDIIESIQLIKQTNIPYEFRTTVCKELLEPKDLIEIAGQLDTPRRYTLQNFKDHEYVLAGQHKFHPIEGDVLNGLKSKLEKMVKEVAIRL